MSRPALICVSTSSAMRGREILVRRGVPTAAAMVQALVIDVEKYRGLAAASLHPLRRTHKQRLIAQTSVTVRARPRSRARSALAATHLFELLADGADILRRRLLQRQRLKHELPRRSAERPIQQVLEHQLLRLLLGTGGMEDERSDGLVAADVALVVHDLHELEHAVVAAVADLLQLV